jgi:hypothetical protein
MSQDNKKRLNLIEVEPDVHAWLVSEANDEGMKIGEFAGYLLEQLFNGNEFINTINPYVKIYSSWVAVRKKQRARERVYDVARLYQELQTEDLAEQLAEMCECADMNLQEVIDRVSNDPFSSIIVQQRSDTKFGQCLKWLPDYLIKNGGEMPVAEIRSAAEKQGFTKSMLGRVKRAIDDDIDTPGIISVRVSEGWNWKVEQLEDVESTNNPGF